MYQLVFGIMKWWLPKETYTQLEMPIPPTRRTSTSLHAPTASQTAPGPKSQPNFNMVVPIQWQCQFPMDWSTSFATHYQELLSRLLMIISMQKVVITFTWKSVTQTIVILAASKPSMADLKLAQKIHLHSVQNFKNAWKVVRSFTILWALLVMMDGNQMESRFILMG